MVMERRGEVNILTISLGFLIFIGIFISLFLFKTSLFASNNVTGITDYNNTYDEMNLIINDMNANTTVDQFDTLFATSNTSNVSGGSVSAEAEMFEKAKTYSWGALTLLPRAIGLIEGMFIDLGINPIIITIASIMMFTAIAYAVLVFWRKGT